MTLNVTCPGHTHTPMNKNLALGTYPPPTRPIARSPGLSAPTSWPDAVLDETTRNTIWELCETHRDCLTT